MVVYEGISLNDFVNLVGGGIAIGAVAVLSAGMIGYTFGKILKLILGRV